MTHSHDMRGVCGSVSWDGRVETMTPLSFSLLMLQRNNSWWRKEGKDKNFLEGLYQRPRGHSLILGGVGREPKVSP